MKMSLSLIKPFIASQALTELRVDLQLWRTSPAPAVRRCCSGLRLSVWRTGEVSEVFYRYAESKVLRPGSTAIFLRARSESVFTKIKKKNVFGEVHRWRGRWLHKHLHVE